MKYTEEYVSTMHCEEAPIREALTCASSASEVAVAAAKGGELI